VGFIGLGNMGVRIARWVADGGFPLTVWARRPASLEPVAGTAAIAGSPADVGRASDIVAICVWADADVEEVLLGPEGVLCGLSPDGIVIVHSTVAPDTCRRLAGAAAGRGVAVVDAPVSVGTVPGRLLVMVGGEQAAVDRCWPVLETFGEPIVHLGPLGSGQLAKLVNNSLLAAGIGLADDAIALGVALGLDRDRLVTALQYGSASNTPGVTMLMRTREALAGRVDEDSHSLTANWATKDVALTMHEAEQRGIAVDRPVLALGRAGARLSRPRP
jgi:3-hydroxyisobutyrate dehydrogenase-like beta-hydroxyacid dehydrogenase